MPPPLSHGRQIVAVFEHLRQVVVDEFGVQALPQLGGLKHLRATLEIELAGFVHAESQRDERGDDRAGTRSRDIVKVIGQHEVGFAARGAQLLLNFCEDFNGNDPANAAAVAREQFAGPVLASLSLNEGAVCWFIDELRRS